MKIKTIVSLLLAMVLLSTAVPVLASIDASAGTTPTWSISTLFSTNDVGRYSSLALDANDNLYVSYHDDTDGSLMFATNAGGTWVTEVIESGPTSGRETSLAVDAAGKAYLAYYDIPNNNLKYATNKGGSWVRTPVDQPGDVGQYLSIALDSNNVFISYYDATNGDLKLATNTTGSWVISTLDSIGNVGLYTSIAIDHNNKIHISYYDATNFDLKYATNAGGAWTYYTIDAAATVGEYTDIAVDSHNKIHIAYWDVTTGQLKYANNVEGSWTLGPISSSTMIGTFSALVLDSDENAHIAYFDSLNGDLKYANNIGGFWTISTVDSVNIVGQYPSLALDSNDNVQIVYYDQTNMDLKYARQVIVAPDAPTGLTASASDSQIELSWTAPFYNGGSAITGYAIYRGAALGAETLITTIGDQLTYVDATVVNGETYWYYVAAINSAEEGAASNEVSSTPMTTPDAPSLQAAASNTYVTLSWTVPTDNGGSSILYFKIYRGTASGTEIHLMTVSNMLAFIDAGLTNGQTYWYYVTAVNAAGEGAASNEVDAKPMTVSTAPASLETAVTSTGIVLTWAAPASDGGSAIEGYSIYRGLGSGAESFLISIGDLFTYEDADVDLGSTYWYYVTAINAVGESPRSNEAATVVLTAATAPGDLEAVSGDASIGLSWSVPTSDGGSAITGYNIYRGPIGGGEELLTFVTGTTYTDTGLENGVEYYYYVTAVTSEEGAPSAEVSAIPMTVPSAAIDLTATAGNSQVRLNWTAPSSDGGSTVTGYAIYRGTLNGTETFLVQVGNVTNYVDAGLTNDQKYWYYVAAVNAEGVGPGSDEISVTPMTVPSAPVDLKASAGTASITLSWTAPIYDGGSAITNYSVFRGTSEGGETLLMTLGNVTSYVDSSIVAGDPYWYYVVPMNVAGSGMASDEASAIVAVISSAPIGLSAVFGTDFVSLNWVAPSDNGGSSVTNYSVFRGPLAGEETFLVRLSDVRSYLDLDVEQGNIYWYYVTANNTAGQSASSNEVVASMITTPTEPIGLEAVAGDVNITLNWNMPGFDGGSDIISYAIYRGNGSGDAEHIATVHGALSYVDEDVADGQTYTYYVVAVNSIGGGNESNVATASIPLPEEDNFDWFPWILIILLVLLVLLVYYYHRKKLKEEREKKGPEIKEAVGAKKK